MYSEIAISVVAVAMVVLCVIGCHHEMGGIFDGDADDLDDLL